MPEAAYKTIITAQEVLYYTPRHQGTDVNNIKHLVPLKEEGLFNVWLGLDWYAALLDDLVDHSGFSHFQEGQTYALDTVVLWRDRLYKVSGDPNSAGTLPSDEAYWIEAPKFTTAANEYLWKRYLRTVLAWAIMHTGLVYQAIQQTSLGLVQAGSSDQQRPVSGRQLANFKGEVGEDLNSFLQTMNAYLVANASTFPLYKGNQTGTDCNGNGSGLQIGYGDAYYGFSF